jgi:hypothetical protein
MYCGTKKTTGKPEADVNRVPDKAFVRSDDSLNDFNHKAICGDSRGYEERRLPIVRRFECPAQWIPDERECDHTVRFAQQDLQLPWGRGKVVNRVVRCEKQECDCGNDRQRPPQDCLTLDDLTGLPWLN